MKILFKNHIYENDGRVHGRKLSDIDNTKKYVNIYRATNIPIFHTNDYVTLSSKFAIEHAESNHAVEDETQYVIRKFVKTSDVAEASNPGEYFYIGSKINGDVVYITLGPDEYEGNIPNLSYAKPIKLS